MRRANYLLTILGVALLAFTTYRLAIADVTSNSSSDDICGFADLPCLVTFNLGAKDVQSMVLVDSSIIDIGGKRFLRGTVTDKYPDAAVAFPGRPTYIALERIAHIQLLDVPKPLKGE